MKRRARSGMVLALWVLSLVLAAVAVSLDAVGPSPKSPLGEVVALVVEVLAFTTAGALVASRRPESPIGWLLLAEGLVWELVGCLDAYVRYSMVPRPGALPGGALAAWVLNWVWIPAFGIQVLFFLLFPDGRVPGSRWRVVLWLALLSSVSTFAARAFMPGPLTEAPAIVNPFGLRGGAFLRVVEGVGSPLLGLAEVAAIVSLVIRFRRADGVQRRQLKWLALAGVVIVAGGVLADVVELTGVVRVDSGNLFLASLAVIPIGAAIAVLRHRLYEIDVVIGKAIVLGGLGNGAGRAGSRQASSARPLHRGGQGRAPAAAGEPAGRRRAVPGPGGRRARLPPRGPTRCGQGSPPGCRCSLRRRFPGGGPLPGLGRGAARGGPRGLHLRRSGARRGRGVWRRPRCRRPLLPQDSGEGHLRRGGASRAGRDPAAGGPPR